MANGDGDGDSLSGDEGREYSLSVISRMSVTGGFLHGFVDIIDRSPAPEEKNMENNKVLHVGWC